MIALKPNIPQQSSHQLISYYGLQPRLDVIRRSDVSGTSLHARYFHPGHKLPVLSEINLTTYPDQQTVAPKYQPLPSPRDPYQPQPGQLYPRYRLPSLPVLPDNRLYNLQQQQQSDFQQSTQKLSQSHAAFQHHRNRRPDENQLPENGTVESENPKYWKLISRGHLEQSQSQHSSSMQDENQPYQITGITQMQQSYHPVLTQQQKSEYRNHTIKPYSESVAASFNQQWFTESTVTPPYEVIHSK